MFFILSIVEKIKNIHAHKAAKKTNSSIVLPPILICTSFRVYEYFSHRERSKIKCLKIPGIEAKRVRLIIVNGGVKGLFKGKNWCEYLWDSGHMVIKVECP